MLFQSNQNANLLKDYGGEPIVLDLEKLAYLNNNFRLAIWTGERLQTTLMQIPVGGAIGLEMHHDVDQLLIVADGVGMAKMGKEEDALTYQRGIKSGCGIFIPACTWHNIINTGSRPLKLISVYAPPQHPFGTVHATKADADRAEEGYGK